MRVRLVRQVVEISHDGNSSVSRMQTVVAELRFEGAGPRPLGPYEIAGQWQVAEELSPDPVAVGVHHVYMPPDDVSIGPETTCAAPGCGQPRSAEVHRPE